MLLTVLRIYPDPCEQEGARAFLSGSIGKTRVQPGCIGCSLSIEQDPESILYVELWETEEDLTRRLRSDDYKKILMAMELSAREPQVVVYDVSKQQGLEFIEKVRLSSLDEGSKSGG